MSILPLPPSTVKLITSTQIITSVSTAVKELVENSLDAGATNIDVKVDNNGLDRIEVKDDGSGISLADASYMGLPNHTSKISSFSDIDALESYGFRGEAVNALCQVGNVVVTTATSADAQGMIYVLDKDGRVASSKPTHKVKGTCIVVSCLFKNIPVRRQFLSNGRRAKEELRATEAIVKNLAVINPQVRVTLSHNRCLIWQKTAVTELRQGLVYMLGYTPARELHELKSETSEVKIEALVPRIGCDISILSKSTPDSGMVFVNRRPVQYKNVIKMANELITQHFGERLLQRKSPIYLISIVLNPAQVDVNLEPNKTRVLVKDEETLLEEVKNLLVGYYGDTVVSHQNEEPELSAKKRKIDDSDEAVPAPERDNRLCKPQKEDRLAPTVEIIERRNIHGSEPLLRTIHPKYPCNDSITPTTTTTNSELNVHEKENLAENIIQAEDNSSILANQRSTNVLDESINPEKWSMGHVKTTSGNFIQPSLVLNQFPARRPPPPSPPPRPVLANGELARALSPVAVEENNLPNLGATDVDQFISSIPPSDFEEDWLQPSSPEKRSENFHPVKTPPRPRLEKKCRKMTNLHSVVAAGQDDMDLSTVSVSSQMGRKELAGFTKFARDVRPQIILENPGVSFTMVAVMLANKWKSLSNEEREVYEDRAREHVLARKNKDDFDNLQPKLSFETIEKASNARYLAAKPKKTLQLKNVSRCEIPYHVSIDSIRLRSNKNESAKRCGPSDDEIVLIGHLQPSGGWICSKGGRQMFLISTCRLQEVVLTHRLLSMYSIPLRPLQFVQYLDEGLLGADNWNLLLSLDRTVCDLNGKTMVISSPIIVKNGFRIQVLEKERLEVTLTHVAETISYYGVEELKETLRLAITNGKNDLSACRPLKVVCQIRSEAVRLCRQDASITERNVLQELLLYWKTYLPETSLCLHSKPIWTNFYNINPATDSVSSNVESSPIEGTQC